MYYAKLLKTKKGNYLYDSYVNTLYEIDENIARCIESGENQEGVTKYITGIGERNFYEKPDTNIEHNYNTQKIKDYIDNNTNMLILSITNRCNLNCTYCIYHDKFANESKKDKSMTYEVAIKAIDEYFGKCINLAKMHIGFYGGESLLEFDLIKQLVEYCEENRRGIPITYGTTTNGVMLSVDEIRRYFEKYEFMVNISLDGPLKMNDRYRKTKKGKGTYTNIINNIITWYKENPEYVKKYLTINTVLAPPKNLMVLDDFFYRIPIYNAYSDMSETEFFNNSCPNKVLDDVAELQKIDYSYSQFFVSEMLKNYERYLPQKNRLGNMILPGGPCVPGGTRWYVNTDGEYYPCERVPETEEFRIGDVCDGIDVQKILSLYDRYIEKSKKCDGCWAIRLCGRCYKNIGESCEEVLKRAEHGYIYFIEEIKDKPETMYQIESITYN